MWPARNTASLALAVCASFFVTASGQAQPAHDFTTYRPTAEAARIENRDAPKIDGDLSDAIWSKTKAIDEFFQIEPKGGEPATERTVVRVIYDSSALYVSFYCYDSDPTHIPLGAKARDINVTAGDFVRVYLDPNESRRNGYVFEVNVPGGREDGLLSNNGEPLYEWNTLWAAKTKRVADGWTVEMMIPFKSLSYDAKRTTWGIDFYRRMNRVYQRVRWTSAAPSIDTFDLTHEGTLTGITGITQGIGLEIQAYGAVRYKHEWVAPGQEDDIKLAESGQIKYKLTPALTGTVTFNPDFSNTPLDDRKINTTQFALFFPETRDFFLQDASAFEFGGIPFSTNFGDVNGMPFFSRNIGLVDGVPVPIRFGGKVSGQIGDWNVGGFSALTDGLGLQNRQWLSVVRVSHPVLNESKVGLIFTNGDPTGLSNNNVLGGDFQYRNSHFGGDKTINVQISALRSESDVTGRDEAYALAIQYPNEPYYGRMVFRQIGTNYNPALGFVNRTGIRDMRMVTGRLSRFEHPFFQWVDTGLFQHYTTGLDGKLQSAVIAPYAGFQNRAADQAFINIVWEKEVVPTSFGLGGPARVDAGTYKWWSVEVNGNFSQKRSVYGWWDIICCDFYNGKAFQLYTGWTWHPGETWEFGPGLAAFIVDMPSGSAAIYAPSFNVNVNFTPDMTIRSQAQYDNMSHSLSFSIRYRWEYAPGAEFFAAAGENALITNQLWHSHYASQTTQASVRIGHTFRF